MENSLRWKYSAAGKTSRNTPTVSLNTFGSACSISVVPSGTPIRPPIRNGQTMVKSMVFQIEGRVEICATTEQISTSGTAIAGGST